MGRGFGYCGQALGVVLGCELFNEGSAVRCVVVVAFGVEGEVFGCRAVAEAVVVHEAFELGLRDGRLR